MRRITRGRLEPARLAAAVASPRHGASALFAGVVRAFHAGRQVTRLDYDCFAPLAEKELERILREAARKWPARVEAAHRVGALRVGDTAVVVAAGAAHRAEAFAACRWTIDEIKRRLPVWKREHGARGPGRWLPGCSLHGKKR